jgi:polyhydroxybutyrate depolymerase
MRKILAILLLFNCVFSFAQNTQVITHNGVKRSFIYYTPSTWTQSESMPLLIVLHGLTQDGGGIMDFSGFNAIAEKNNFVVCYPDGLNRAWNANMNVSISQADDIGFIEEITLIMQKQLNTNPNKQYL